MIAFQQVAYSRNAEESVVRATDVPIPCPGLGELLVRVKATAMNYGDTILGRGGAKAVFNIAFPSIVGRDVAGVIEAIGEGTDTSLNVGDHVVGYVDVGKGRGTFAEYCLLQVNHAERLPVAVSFTDAAALPTAGCTTHQALVGSGVLKMGAGQRILVLGGSTGTGQFAIQLAKHYGCAEIAATSSQAEFCLALGATTVINHRAGQKWEDALAGRNFDILYDCAEGLSAWRKAPAVLKPKGARFVSIVMDEPHADVITIPDMLVFVGRVAIRSFWSLFGYVSFTWHINAGSTSGLGHLVELAAQGKVVPALDAPPRPSTWEGFVEMWNKQMSGRAHGKLVMQW